MNLCHFWLIKPPQHCWEILATTTPGLILFPNTIKSCFFPLPSSSFSLLHAAAVRSVTDAAEEILQHKVSTNEKQVLTDSAGSFHLSLLLFFPLYFPASLEKNHLNSLKIAIETVEANYFFLPLCEFWRSRRRWDKKNSMQKSLLRLVLYRAASLQLFFMYSYF